MNAPAPKLRQGIDSPFSRLLGCEVLRQQDGEAEVRLCVQEDLRNRAGLLHGGAIFSLVDIAMGLACSSAHGVERQSVTSECKINYTKAITDGELRCIARLRHFGTRTLVVEAEVLQDNELAALAQATFMLI